MNEDNTNSETLTYDGWKLTDRELYRVSDPLTVESALSIHINGEPLTITMRTPGDDLALTRGILHSENIVKDFTYKPEITLSNSKDNKEIIATVFVDKEFVNKEFTNSRSLLSVASCGICGKTELEDFYCEQKLEIKENSQVSMRSIKNYFDDMRNHQSNFSKTGGCHAAAAFSEDGKLLFCKEDIGRHNAVDKVVGALIESNQLTRASLLLVSGRISYEIVIKCFKARIPILAAVSAPSSLAVDFAKEFGITLLGFCREDRATCYANPSRLSVKNDKFNDH